MGWAPPHNMNSLGFAPLASLTWKDSPPSCTVRGGGKRWSLKLTSYSAISAIATTVAVAPVTRANTKADKINSFRMVTPELFKDFRSSRGRSPSCVRLREVPELGRTSIR